MENPIALIATGLILITSLAIILVFDWRYRLALFAMQYLGVFLLILVSWSITMAVTTLIAGWMVAAILAMALHNSFDDALSRTTDFKPPLNKTQGRTPRALFQQPGLFTFLADCLVIMLVFSIAPAATKWWEGLTIYQAWGGLLLIGLAIVQLGFHSDTLSVLLGLLAFIAGFEILYSGIDQTVLVAGLLALVNLCLGMVGAYLILSPIMEIE